MKIKLLFLSVIFMLTACKCPEVSEEPLYGTWTLNKMNVSAVHEFDDKGTLKLNSDYSFNSNFSYFFTYDTALANLPLKGNWRMETSCYQFSIESQEIMLTVEGISKRWDFSFTDSTMTWSDAQGSSWYKKE